MATIQGQLIDSGTGQPLAVGSVAMDFHGTSDPASSVVKTFYTNDDGSFNISDSVFDQYPNGFIEVSPDGYLDLVGPPAYFNGKINVDPSSVTKTIQSIPVWGWLLIIAAALFLGYKYLYKGKKLF